MKRFLTVVAATAIAAAVTIPALADGGGSPPDELSTFATCLRSHGVPIPADLEGVAIKQWVGDHQDTAGLDAAFRACDPHPSQGEKADSAAPEKLVACLRAKGLQPPPSINDLKPWTLEQFKTESGKAALNACGLAEPEEKDHADGSGGGCGSEKASPAAKEARAARARPTPTT